MLRRMVTGFSLVELMVAMVAGLGVVLTIMTFFGVTNHMGWEIFPRRWIEGWFGRHVISASHHHVHHERYLSNYGLYFRFWDKLCGTDNGLSPDLLAAKERRFSPAPQPR